MGIILQPFAWLLLLFYNLFHSYGIALILFAVVVKLLLFPVTLKSKKSMIQTTMLSEKMQKLQKMYGKDRERYNLELQKLYEKEKVNPMGGCLWSLIPMFVLIALYGVIREPLTYFMGLTGEQIQVLAAQLDWGTLAVANGWVPQGAMDKIVNSIGEKVSNGELQLVVDGLWKNKDGILSGLFQNGSFNQLYLLSQIDSTNLPALQGALNSYFPGAGESLFILDFQFLGIDLSQIPTLMFWKRGMDWGSIGLFLLPVISVVTSFLSMKVSMATNQMNKQSENKQMDSTNKMMLWMMPVMSIWIGFTIPAGLTVYWIAQYFVTMGQEVICGKMLKKDYEPMPGAGPISPAATAASPLILTPMRSSGPRLRPRPPGRRKADPLRPRKRNSPRPSRPRRRSLSGLRWPRSPPPRPERRRSRRSRSKWMRRRAERC